LENVELPNRDIRVTEEMLEENEALLAFLAASIFRAAMETTGVSDFDVRDALDALTRTWRTLQSGVYYETRPTNPLAFAVYDAVKGAVDEFRSEEKRNLGMARTRDAQVLALLVFLQRVELDRNNGRRRGRAFIDSIRRLYPDSPPPGEPERS